MDSKVLERSVTSANRNNGNGATLQIFLSGAPQADLPAWWSPKRDQELRASIRRETGWGNAVGIALTRMASWAWEVEGDIGLRVRRAQDMLLSAEGGKGWVNFSFKIGRDFLTTDNGLFVEIVHQTGAPGSRILGLMHLDACRCVRTDDPSRPVIYWDKRGRPHELRDHQVMMLSDMPDPSESYNGVGDCAAGRAWYEIVKMQAIEQYIREKVSGRRPLELHVIGGLNDAQLKDALATGQAEANSRGIRHYMGALMIATMGDQPVTVASIPLASLPDAFNAAEERKKSQLEYANALGIDPQDLNPDLLATRALGTGAQSTVIDDKAGGKGLVAFRQGLTHLLNQNVLDSRTTFHFYERDLRDEERRANLSQKRGEFASNLVTTGVITPAQALQHLVDFDELPKEFLPVDATPDEVLSDGEKPDGDEVEIEEKAIATVEDLLEEETDAALTVYGRMVGNG